MHAFVNQSQKTPGGIGARGTASAFWRPAVCRGAGFMLA
jgi:hypothetical protein